VHIYSFFFCSHLIPDSDHLDCVLCYFNMVLLLLLVLMSSVILLLIWSQRCIFQIVLFELAIVTLSAYRHWLVKRDKSLLTAINLTQLFLNSLISREEEFLYSLVFHPQFKNNKKKEIKINVMLKPQGNCLRYGTILTRYIRDILN
jgi:hypothetical protein